jgi:2-polyprenyl-3-methyl-5-hydroxy-6-metoxy-1,4-benzoquinol methylase
MENTSQYSEHAFVRDSQNNSWANMFTFIPEGARVLDVGCSSGNFGQALEQLKGCTVVGVDLNADDIATASARISEAYVLDVNDAEALARLGTFDVVVAADVLEHMYDPREVLRSLTVPLGENGILVYSIPNMAHTSVRLGLLAGEFVYTETGLLDRTHMHFYDHQEIASMFADANYVITEQYPVVSELARFMVDQRLAALGLEAADEFYEMLDVTGGNIFQYIGVAVPSREGVEAPEVRERRMPMDEMLELVNTTRAENSALLTEIEATREHLAYIKHHPIKYAVGKVTSKLRRNKT